MEAKIYSNKQLLGTINVRVGDYHMGGLIGEFAPIEYYLEHIQKGVWKFNESIDRDFCEWESFGFAIVLENGHVLEPLGGICISDYPEMFGEPIPIEVAGVDTAIIDRYFDTTGFL